MVARWWLADWEIPHSQVRGRIGRQDRPCNPEFQQRKIKSQKPLAVKISGKCGGGRNSSLTGEFVGEIHRVLECTEAPHKQKLAP